MNVNVVKTVTVRGKTEGLAGVKAELDGVAASQDNVAKSGDAMARSSETSARRQLSAGKDFQRLMERHDRMIYLQTQLARETATVNRAFEQGAIDSSRHAAAIALVESRYQGLVAAETKARAAAQGLVVANDNQSASLHRLAAANDNARHSTANIAAQFQDVAVTSAMGVNPIMIALQQGTQLSGELNKMQNPIRGLASAFLSMLNPVSLLTIGFIALGAAAIQWFMSARAGAEDAVAALERHDKWLDSILEGYQSVREAAKLAGEEARRLPQEIVEIDLAAGLRKQEEEMRTIDRNIAITRDSITRTISDLKSLEDTGASVGPTTGALAGYISQIEALRDLNLSIASTDEQLKAAMLAARDLFHATDDTGIRDMADQVFILANQLYGLRGRIDETVAAQDALNMTDLSGMEDWTRISNDTRLGLSMVERAALAAAWAVANSGDAAVVAASQYGTATGAANAYANAMFRLGSLIPEVAAAQAQFAQLKQAEASYSAAIRENQAALDARSISLDEFLRRQQASADLYGRAQDQANGLTDATKALADAERQAQIGGMGDREAAAARITDRYAELTTQLKAAGASDEALARANAAMNRELAASNASFDQMAAKAGGAGKALKDAEQDFKSFTGTADKLAEALFPGEYARREAAELMALLDQYRGKMDNFQIAAVEREIDNLNKAGDQGLRRLEDRAAETGDAVWKTLGSVLSGLFDGPMRDMDAFFDKALKGFAQLGSQNLSKLFDGGGAANDNGAGATNLFDAIFKGSKAGTQEGAQSGMMGLLKGSNLGAMASAGLGGLGLGYQSQDPVMGGLGGAAQGAMAGMAGGPAGMAIGAVIGGLGGVIGGLFGMNKALQEAQQKLNDNRQAIEQFMAAANGEKISSYAKAIADYNKQASELIALAQKAGDAALVGQLQAANNNVVATLGKEFIKDIEGSINRLRGDDFLNDAVAAQDAYNLRMKDAVMLGVDASSAFTELSLTLRKIVTDSNLTGDQLARLTAMFPTLANELRLVASSMSLVQAQSEVDRARQALRESYEKEATSLREVVERNRAFVKSLESFKASLRLDQNLSGLSPLDKFLEAQSQFNSISTAALGGDADAIGKLEAASRSYLEGAKGYYASSEQYFAIFAQVESVLDRVTANASGVASEAERQLAALDRQVSLLIEIDRSVMSVADAVYSLAVAMANLTTVQGGGYVPLPGFDTGGSFTVGGNGGTDQNLLSINGRASARVGRGEIVNIQRPGAGNDNAELVAEIRALRSEQAAMNQQLIAVTAASGKIVAEAAATTTEAVRAGNRVVSQAGLKRP